MSTKKTFTRYEVFIIAILTIVHFTVILDFVVLSPLGAILMPEMDISPAQFGLVVSVYAFSAGASGILAAGFADKFDRKKLLLFFYVGFVIGTFFCGIAEGYGQLLAARIFTGIFGGVIGAVGFAIVTDLFRMEVRGRVMGFLQMAFAGSQVLGLPIGLKAATIWNWHVPFLMIVVVSIIVGIVIVIYMKPVTAHLATGVRANAFNHLIRTTVNPNYLQGFLATILLATGGFMLMPFASAYSVNNLGLDLSNEVPILYTVTGVISMAVGPLIGKLADRLGKFQVFFIGTVLSMIIVMVYCYLGLTPLWAVIIVSVIMFTGVSSRIISSQALISGVPDSADRGAFMSINSSVSQIAGGIATIIAGMIIYENPDGKLQNYPLLGLVVCGCMIITIVQMYFLDQFLKRKLPATATAAVRS